MGPGRYRPWPRDLVCSGGPRRDQHPKAALYPGLAAKQRQASSAGGQSESRYRMRILASVTKEPPAAALLSSCSWRRGEGEHGKGLRAEMRLFGLTRGVSWRCARKAVAGVALSLGGLPACPLPAGRPPRCHMADREMLAATPSCGPRLFAGAAREHVKSLWNAFLACYALHCGRRSRATRQKPESIPLGHNIGWGPGCTLSKV